MNFQILNIKVKKDVCEVNNTIFVSSVPRVKNS